jgi:ADP-heptose:LPS heptosyltransferase
VNPLTELFGARRSAGFFLPGDYCPDREWFMPWPERGLELRRLLGLVEFLGAPARGEELEFPLGDRDLASLSAIDAARGLEPRRYVCVHPGASCAERRWPVERFAAVARHLTGRGFRVVLTGTAAESGLTAAVALAAGVPCVDLSGRTDLGAAGALIGRARLLVCNDTGVSHLAAALRVPSVVISTGRNRERWAPVDASLHRVLCADAGVGADEVIAQADDLLRRRGKEAAATTLMTA